MMEEKMLPVPNEGHRRRQKQRRRRFPWGSIATVILVVLFVYMRSHCLEIKNRLKIPK